jgi:NAD dependent epimerase/dehydratase family enzyme
MIEAASLVLRTESELVLKSRRVIPGRLLDAGFTFMYPDWPSAAQELALRLRKLTR